MSLGPEQTINECPECHIHVPNLPTNEELRNMTDEARLRVIKAMKVCTKTKTARIKNIEFFDDAFHQKIFQISYWAHFERGVLTEVAVQILASVADSCADKELYMVHCRDLKKYWQIRGVFPWLRSQLVMHLGEGNVVDIPPPPEKK